MTTNNTLSQLLALAICTTLMATPLVAQRRKETQPAAKEATRGTQPALTIENLLAADDYKVYGEIKNIGQLILSPNISDVLDPLMKLASPPQEFKSLVKFARAHAELLTTSRMSFAAWPVKSKLPQTLFAIEFSSEDEASKFEPQLREFLTTMLPAPTPGPTPAEPGSSPKEARVSAPVEQKHPEPRVEKPAEAKALPFAIKLVGNLVLVSDTTFNLKNLRPDNSEPLFDNGNFRQAHDRFGSEQIFLFFNVALDERKPTANVEQSKLTTKPPTVVLDESPSMPGKDSAAQVTVRNSQAKEGDDSSDETPQVGDSFSISEQRGILVGGASQLPDNSSASAELDLALSMTMGSIFGGTPKWPDAVGAAIAFEGDTYVARVLLVGGPDGKAVPVPFISQWVSGPALNLEAPSILPADTELFIAASLDTPQIYEGLATAMSEQATRYQRASGQPNNETQPLAPFAALEKKMGIKIKDELLPVLGNEIAVSLPVNTFFGTAGGNAAPGVSGSDQAAARKRSSNPVFVISLKDKEATRTLLPRIVEGLGFKGAATLAQTEKRDDVEIVSYGGFFSYAFIGNSLVVSLDAATINHVVDSYLNHQTLASDSQFRDHTRWQPRQLLGQVYVSPALMERYRAYANNPTALVSDRVRDFLMRLSPVSEPVTYSLSSDGLGPLHELHVPRNLILMMVGGIFDQGNQTPLVRNEQMTRSALSMIANSEAIYRQNQGKGQYASLEQLIDQQLVIKEMLKNNGYRIDLIVNGDKFIANAVPNEYNKTGRLSYFVDESGVVRGGDHGGAPALPSDSALQ